MFLLHILFLFVQLKGCFFQIFLEHFLRVNETVFGFAKRVGSSRSRSKPSFVLHPHLCLGRHFLRLLIARVPKYCRYGTGRPFQRRLCGGCTFLRSKFDLNSR
uniref:Secreted protein n=1 Tax=Cacopsylla melanoneura TaxID=428564 RepID=A0A8D8Y7L2_9HEMI